MAPSRRKGAKAAAAAAAARRQWKVGDLVLAKVKGFPAWPATVSEPEKWGYSVDLKKVLVYFFGTKQIAFCNPVDVEEFTEEKKVSLLGKRQGRGADFVRAVQEIVDCFDKLKEKNQVDRLSSGDVAAEKDAVAAISTAVPDTACDLALRSVESPRPKNEQTLAVEDVGALTDVECFQPGGAAEEPADDSALSMAMPNTYTLRKKSRTFQLQRCTSQKRGSAQRSRCFSRFDSTGIQNGVLDSGDGKSSADGFLNGFIDGPLRKAKRSRRSPDDSVPNIADLPGKLNGTVDENGSEVGMVDSENLSNNEGSTTESECKREQSETVSGRCERSLELSRILDFHSKTSIVRKKRNPGRKRIQCDGIESSSKTDQEVDKDTCFQQDTLAMPSLHGNVGDKLPNDEGDEHLPLVKRARVRMGKLLSEDQEQLGFHEKSEGTPVETTSASVVQNDNPSVKCDDIKPKQNSLMSNDSIVSSPVDNCSQVPENKPQPQKTLICVVNESEACLILNNCAQSPDNKMQPLDLKASQPFGSSFDGESALPPSKRLHRALEAMSANVAEESQTPAKETASPKTENEVNHLPLEICSKMVMEDNNGDKLVSGNNCTSNEGSLVPCNDCPGASNISNPSACEAITKAVIDIAVVDSSDRDLGRLKNTYLEDIAEEAAVSTDGKEHRLSDSFGASHSIPQDQALLAKLPSATESDPILRPLITVISEQLPQESSKSEDEEINNGVTENYESQNKLFSETCIAPLSMKEAVDACCDDDTAMNTCIGEAKCSAAADLSTALVDETTQTTKGVSLDGAVEDVKHAAIDVNMDSLSPPLLDSSSPQRTCYGASTSGSPWQDRNYTSVSLSEVDVQKHGSLQNDLIASSNNKERLWHIEGLAVDTKRPCNNHVSDVAESNGVDSLVHHETKSGERTNLAEVKAALASLELTLGTLTRTKESIGRATRIAVDCVKFGIAAEVVDLLALFLEKESSLYRRVDLFFLVDSIAQSSRGLKGEVGSTYISAVKDSLARMLSAAAPAGQNARENRRQCLKVLRLWLERKILPESIIRKHIREIDSQNCSTSGYSRRMSRTERSFDDPILDMEGMHVDEYGSNSSFQLPGFCMPCMLREEDDGSDSDGGVFEAVTPEHDSKNKEIREAPIMPTTEKHRHILEDVDGELEMEDVAPTCNVEMDQTTTTCVAAADTRQDHFPSYAPPLPHDGPPRQPPLPTSPPPLPPLPPPLPPPPPLALAPHATAMPHVDVDPHLHVVRNGMQETMPSRPPVPGLHPIQMPVSTSCSYNSYPLMHNPVAPGNNLPSSDANMYGNNTYNVRPRYPSPTNQFSYHSADHQFRPQREAPPPPPPPPQPYYDHTCFGQGADGGRYYGEQDNGRPSRPELTDGWGYSRPPFPGPSCEPIRRHNHGWGYPPPPVHHRSHIPDRPPCDNGVPVGARAPGYWRPR